ncbi:CUB domain-containing protein [Wenyingzhuangia sp. IMCC45574]
MKNILIAFLCMFSLSFYSQINPWSSSSFNNASLQHSKDYNQIKTYELNKNLLQNIGSLEIISFPDDKGNIKTFRVLKKSVFSEELAQKYPEIKTYYGTNINNQKETIRFNYNKSIGISGIIHRPNKESLIIKPEKNATTHHFYKFSNESYQDKLECETIQEVKTKSFKQNSTASTSFSNGLRKYRLAVAASGEYSNFFLDGTETTDHERKIKVLTAITNSLIRLNEIFERDFGITMELVGNNDDIIYLDSNSDPFIKGTQSYNSQLQTVLDSKIKNPNYDIGHLFHHENSRYGNAGCIACTCTTGKKGSGFSVHQDPASDDMNLLIAHEMGHQFGSYHVQGSRVCRSGLNSEVEPGSGSTIMSYAGICSDNVQDHWDDYFNYVDIRDVKEWIINGSSCATIESTNNQRPTVDAGKDYFIPKSTPFVLEAIANDTDSSNLTYCWEQNDPENPNSSAPYSSQTVGPLFRSFLPTQSSSRYFPELNSIVNNINSKWEVLPSVAREMEFVITVRDNNLAGGETASDAVSLTVANNSSSFFVKSLNTNQKIKTGSPFKLEWNVGNTDQLPINVSEVEVYISTDGGISFPHFITKVPNTGSATISLPFIPETSNARLMIKAVDNIFFNINKSNFTIETGEIALFSQQNNYEVCAGDQIEIPFTYQTFAAYSGNTELSIVNKSNFLDIQLSQNSISGIYTNGIKLNAIVNTSNNTQTNFYNFTIKAKTDLTEVLFPVKVLVKATKPAKTTLTTPNNNIEIPTIGYNFTWSKDLFLDYYSIEIALDSSFNNIIESNKSHTSSYSPKKLNYNSTYYWRVGKKNSCSNIVYSDTRSFTTSSCYNITNIKYQDHAHNFIKFNWDDPVSYAWEIKYAPVGYLTSNKITVKEPSALIKNLKPGTNYNFSVAPLCNNSKATQQVFSTDHCTTINYLNGHSITNNSISLQWISSDIKTDWIIEYGPSGFSIGKGTKIKTSDRKVQIDELEENTSYDFYITPTCDPTKISRKFTYKTEYCETVSYPYFSDVKTNSLKLSWGSNNAISWTIEYGKSGFKLGDGNILNSKNNTIALNGLEEDTTYDFYITSHCNLYGTSNTSKKYSTKTRKCGSITTIRSSNLTKNSVDLSWSTSSLGTSWTIEYGVSGFKIGYGIIIETNNTSQPISNLEEDTNYDFYITSHCSPYSNSETIKHVIKTLKDYKCGDYFYDTGGEKGNYLNNESYVITIYPSEEGKMVSLDFDLFDLTGSDYFEVFDGTSTNGYRKGYYSNYYKPQKITSSHNESGALTIKFYSYSYSTPGKGWKALVSCVESLSCGDYFYDTGGEKEDYFNSESYVTTIYPSEEGKMVSVNFEELELNTYDYLDVFDGDSVNGNLKAGLNSASSKKTITSTNNKTGALTFRFRSNYSGQASGWKGLISCVDPIGCGDYFYDTGGASENYQQNENYTITIHPSEKGKRVSLDFEDFDLGNNSYFYIYNGTSTSGSSVRYSNSNIPTEKIVSTDSDSGALTVRFYSYSYSTTGKGWKALVGCEDPITYTCGEYFYDTGGENGNYSNNENYTVTVYPNTPGKMVSVNFEDFNLGSYAYLYVYDGTSANGNSKGIYNNYTKPTKITSSDNTTGALTFKFISNSYSSPLSGWKALISCVEPIGCGDYFYDTGGENGDYQYNEDYTITIFPEQKDKMVNLNFESFDLGSNDYLYIYNGTSTSNLIGSYNRSSKPSQITSSDLDSGALTIRFDSNSYSTATGWKALISCVAPLKCGNYFYDTGGENNNYSKNENYTVTIYPDSQDKMVNVDFEEFDLEDYAYLYVYDGTSTSGNYKDIYTKFNKPTTITSSDSTTGALTFRFISSSYYSPSKGWKALINCVEPIKCGDYFYDTGGETGNYDNDENYKITLFPETLGSKVTLDFESLDLGVNDYLHIYNGKSTSTYNKIASFTNGSSNPGIITPTDYSGAITIQFISNSDENHKGWKALVGCIDPSTLPKPKNKYQCGDYFYDTGGNTNNYYNNESYTVTFYPDTPGDMASLDFESFELQGTDVLSIYNGSSTQSTLIGSYKENNSPKKVTSNDPTGALTVRFKSNSFTTSKGWKALFSCITPSTCTPINIDEITTTNGNNTLQIKWPSENGISWQIEYGISGFTFGEGTIVNTNVPNYNFNDLKNNTVYDFYFTNKCRFSNSTVSNKITINSDGIINPIDLECGEYFYDTGGENGMYKTSENYIQTFYPQDEDKAVKLNFESFKLGRYSFLQIYNGDSTSSELIEVYEQSKVPSSVISTDDSGALTIKFLSYSFSTVDDGWKALIECVEKPCKIFYTIDDIVTTNLSPTKIKLEWNNSNEIDYWKIEYGKKGFVPAQGNGTVFNTRENSFTANNLLENTEYDFYITPYCHSNNSGEIKKHEVSTTYNFCNQSIYDTGGENGNYSNNENYKITILPLNENEKASITFEEFDLETNFDFLYVYNGKAIPNNLIEAYTGNTIPKTIVSSHQHGVLTLVFTSDEFNTSTGWKANINCNAEIIGCVIEKTENYIQNGSFECNTEDTIDNWTTNEDGIFKPHFNSSTLESNTFIKNLYPTDLNKGLFLSFDSKRDNTNYTIEQKLKIPEAHRIISSSFEFDFNVNYDMSVYGATKNRSLEVNLYNLNGDFITNIEKIDFGLEKKSNKLKNHSIKDITNSLRDLKNIDVILKIEAIIPEESTGPAKAMIDNVKLNITSVSENSSSNIYITPNPAVNMIKIMSLQQNETISDFFIYHLNGSIVKNEKFLNNSLTEQVINLELLSNGVYYLKVITNKNSYVKQLIISK